MNLYEINQAILDCVDFETGEIIDEEKLNQLSLEKNQKIENIGLWIKNLVAESNEIKAEEENLKQRRTYKENKIKSLKSYLNEITGYKPFETAKVKISYRKSTAVNVLDEKLIPEEYKEIVETTKINKVDLGKALKSGINISGAELLENQNIQIK